MPLVVSGTPTPLCYDLTMNLSLPTRRLTVDEFLAWAVRQTEGK